MSVRPFRGPLPWRVVLTGLILSSCALAASAQAVRPDASGPGRSASPGILTPVPAWSDLSPAEQKVLQPLSTSWPGLTDGQKRKWLAMARSYPRLPEAEQSKLRARMADWAAMSPQQRAQARLNFGRVKELSPAERRARWEAYQALSPQERQQLRAQARARPKGSALAAQPVPREKLARPPRPAGPALAGPAPRRQPRIEIPPMAHGGPPGHPPPGVMSPAGLGGPAMNPDTAQ